MNKNLNQAMDNVETTYSEVVDLATDILTEFTEDIDALMDKAYTNIENLSNDAIRELLLSLALRAYSLGAIKDKSAFKATLAETLRKEAYATQFNQTDGTVAVRENTAILNTSAEIVVEQVYDLTSSLFKTRLDEVHRVVDSLKTVLTSRLAEAKLTNIDTN